MLALSTLDETEPCPIKIENDTVSYLGKLCSPYYFVPKSRMQPNKDVSLHYLDSLRLIYDCNSLGYAYAYGNKEACLNAIRRMDVPRPQVKIGDELLEKAYHSLIRYFGTYYGRCGIYDLSNVSLINTSPGYAIKTVLNCPSKFDYMREYPELYPDFFKKIVNGDFPFVKYKGRKILGIVSQGFIKEEVTKLKKIVEKQNRLFSSESADVNYMIEIVYGKVLEKISYQFSRSFLCGYSPQKNGFNELIQSMHKAYFLIEGDCKALDLTLWEPLILKFVDFIHGMLDPLSQKRYQNVKKFLQMYLIEHLLLLPTGHLFHVFGRLMSGSKLTSSLGSVCHWLVLAAFFIKKFPESDTWFTDICQVHLMSDDHLNALFTKYSITIEELVEHYEYYGLKLDPSRSFITTVKNFRVDVTKHSILGYRPAWDDKLQKFVPMPKEPNKLIASVITYPYKNNLELFRRVASIAMVAYFDKQLYNALVAILDKAILNGDLDPQTLKHVDQFGVHIEYPSIPFLNRIWLGYESEADNGHKTSTKVDLKPCLRNKSNVLQTKRVKFQALNQQVLNLLESPDQ